jgi:hypothetical protein
VTTHESAQEYIPVIAYWLPTMGKNFPFSPRQCSLFWHNFPQSGDTTI